MTKMTKTLTATRGRRDPCRRGRGRPATGGSARRTHRRRHHRRPGRRRHHRRGRNNGYYGTAPAITTAPAPVYYGGAPCYWTHQRVWDGWGWHWRRVRVCD